MQMSVHLNFQGNCADAFAFYAQVFKTKQLFQMKYGDATESAPVPPDWKDKIMHASIPLGDGRLMGCDSPRQIDAARRFPSLHRVKGRSRGQANLRSTQRGR